MTWCDKDEYVKPVGVTVYSVSGVGTDKVTLSEDVSTAQVGEETVSIIPAYTPVLIHRTAAGTGAVTAAFASAGTGTAGIQTAQGTQGCTFYGTTTAQSPIPADNYSDGLTYVLYGDKFIRTNSSYGIAANRCWLVIANPAGARLNILLDETTGLSEALRVEREATDAWYSLDGRRLQGKPSAKGVYINKGKKTVVK